MTRKVMCPHKAGRLTKSGQGSGSPKGKATQSQSIASHLAESTLVLRGSDHPTGDTYTQMLNDTSNMMTHDDIIS
jgi:hypothetical protein